jgi:F0F1-type ATP synthase assembly protein I
MSDQPQNAWAQVARYLSLAVLLPVSSLAGYGIGYLLDQAFSTHALKTVFLILGTVAGFVQLLRSLGKE